MNKSLILLALLALTVVNVAAQDAELDEGVLVLTDDNFDATIAKYEHILVEFYAPWCGHCKKLAPEFADAAGKLKSAGSSAVLAKLDATEQKKAAEKFSIQGFPTLKFFVKGQDMEYNGGRTSQEIITWLNKRTGSISTNLQDQSEFDRFLGDNTVAVVYFGESENDEAYSAFKTAAMSFDKLGFAHVLNNADLNAHGKASNGQVVVFKKFDEGRAEYSGAMNANELKKWIDSHQFATVMEFDDRAIEKVFQQSNPTIFLFASESDASKQALEEFTAVAHKLKGGKVIFAVTRPNDGHGHWQRLADYVGVNTEKAPQIMLVHAAGDVGKYKFEASEITKESIEKFVNDFNSNRLEKYLKSEEIPEKQEEAVQVIVGKSFNDIVLNNDKDVLVEFYAPWCGHCKTLAPKYEEAAQKLAHNKNIIIAKVDATANEVPSVQVKGFPTIKFFPGNKKNSPVDFEGEREVEGIISWLKDHTTHPWVEKGEHSDEL